MDPLRDNLEEFEIGSSIDSFAKFLDSQKELFHGQIDQLQRIVVTQCKLTGVNPLSQEMAAGAMSIKIGKRPRDLLNPKAIKYLQAVFSMKDAISKKESREISAQFGVTVTQVRDFFASQRSRVKRVVRLSREKAARANSHKEPQDVVSTSCDPMVPIHIAPLCSIHPDPVPQDSNLDSLNSIGSNSLSLNHANSDPVPLNSISASSLPIYPVNPDSVPLNYVGTSSAEEMPSCSTQDDILPGLNDIEKHFVDNIFTLLRKEETFSGQVKQMEWILQIQNPLVLDWFLAKGGVMILATWLTQAAAEEQTSVLHFSLKVLCHLPLHKALPEHMSAVLHSVNQLRFYRTSDISNRARILLSRWSKLFARSQAMKKPNKLRSSINAQEMILKQSIEEIMGNELWEASGGNPEDVSTLVESSENTRKNEPSQTLKLLPASTDESRKHTLGVSSSHARERRRVQYVEQPGQKTANRSPQSSKTVSVSQRRPMSTDDIQKAKMRALFMQNKYGKVGPSSNGTKEKIENPNKPFSTPPSTSLLASKVPLRPKVEEHKDFAVVPPNICNKHENHIVKHKIGSKEHLEELCRKVQIPWQIPPEIKLQDIWRVGIGENSKEVDIQKNRNRREIETFYRTVQEIPSNPKDPWDMEMDYDDTLTPDIPVEQPPDADVTETQMFHDEERVNTIVTPATSFPPVVGGGAAEPDLELLAVLLKNPELVFALTSGQASNISPEETLKLLDVIKRSGAGLASSSNGFPGKQEEKVEVSLPSPTPSSNPGTSGWRPEFAKNPFSNQNNRGNRVSSAESGLLQTQNHANNIRISQQQANLHLASQQVEQYFPSPQATSSSIIHDNRQPSMVIPSRQNPTTSPSMLEMGLPIKNITRHNYPTANARSSMRVEAMDNVNTAPSLPHAPERRQVSLLMPPNMPISTPNRSYSRTPLAPAPAPMHSSRQSTGNISPMPESWRPRQGLVSNSQSRVNQNNHAAPFRGGGPPQVARRERNEYVGEDGFFESWSPEENSPVRSPENRNYPGPRTNGGWNYSHDNNGSRQRNFDNHRDHNWNGNRRYR